MEVSFTIQVDYGNLHLRINEILDKKGISKNKICKDLDIPRTNFNKYCRDGCDFVYINDFLINEKTLHL